MPTAYGMERHADERYEKLPEESGARDSDFEEFNASSTPLIPMGHTNFERHRRYRIWVGIALTILISLSIFQIFLLSAHSSQGAHISDDAPCGTNVEEAKALGCHYSIALGDWLHDECYDHDLEETYRNEAVEFEWYYPNATNNGPDLSRRIESWEELGDRGFPLTSWTTWRFHVDHCLAAWKYMHTLSMQGRKVSAGIARLSHTHHCSMEVMDRSFAMNDVITGHINGFPPCVDIKRYKKTHKYPYEVARGGSDFDTLG